MLHNKRARVLIIVLGLVCAAVLAATLVTRALATQTVTTPNGVTFVIARGTLKDWTIPLNTPVFIGAGGRSMPDVGPGGTRAAWAVVFCNGQYWNAVGQGSIGEVRKLRRAVPSSIVGTVLGFGGFTIAITNTSGGLRMSSSLHELGPFYVYIHY